MGLLGFMSTVISRSADPVRSVPDGAVIVASIVAVQPAAPFDPGLFTVVTSNAMDSDAKFSSLVNSGSKFVFAHDSICETLVKVDESRTITISTTATAPLGLVVVVLPETHGPLRQPLPQYASLVPQNPN